MKDFEKRLRNKWLTTYGLDRVLKIEGQKASWFIYEAKSENVVLPHFVEPHHGCGYRRLYKVQTIIDAAEIRGYECVLEFDDTTITINTGPEDRDAPS